MPKNALEPNHRYRPWLEEHIGEQYKDWDWNIWSARGNSLIVYFEKEEDATLFELAWP
jgi:hypothetical protein